MSSNTGSIGGVPALPNLSNFDPNTSVGLQKLNNVEDQLQRAYLQVLNLENQVTDSKIQAKLQQSLDAIKAKFSQVIAIKYHMTVDVSAQDLINDVQEIDQLYQDSLDIYNDVQTLAYANSALINVQNEKNVLDDSSVSLLSSLNIIQSLFSAIPKTVGTGDPTKDAQYAQQVQDLGNAINTAINDVNSADTSGTYPADPTGAVQSALQIANSLSLLVNQNLLSYVIDQLNRFTTDPALSTFNSNLAKLNQDGTALTQLQFNTIQNPLLYWSSHWTSSDYSQASQSIAADIVDLTAKYNTNVSDYQSLINDFNGDISSFSSWTSTEKSLFQELYPDAASLISSSPSFAPLPPLSTGPDTGGGSGSGGTSGGGL